MAQRVKTISTLLFLLLAVVSSLSAEQDIPAVSEGELLFYLDHAVFHSGDGNVQAEFYLMLFADQLKPIKQGDNQLVVFHVQASIRNHAGDLLHQHEWTTEARIAKDVTDLKQNAIYDQWNERMSPGNYAIEIHVKDENGDKAGRLLSTVMIPRLETGAAFASQIEFVSHAESSSADGPFYKNGRTVFPNPSRRYGVLNPLLLIYYELYNLDETNEKLLIQYTIRDSNGDPVHAFPDKFIDQPGSSISLVHGMDVSTIPSGIYQLEVSLSDNDSHPLLSFSRSFEIIQMDYLVNQQVLSPEAAETAGQLLKYIASPEEYKFYQELGLTGKAQFLVRFWRNQDPTPGTLENEYLQAIKERYRYANEHFGWAKTEGWATDKGYVLIKYGMPSEIARFYAEADIEPYEIWYYQEDRTYQFIFGDVNANGRFALLHSTREDEVHNANWREWLKKF